MDVNKPKLPLADLTDLNWLKQHYFSNAAQRLTLQAGDQITEQGVVNDKMFFVESGRTSGYYKPEDSEEFRVFTTGPNMIVGIYSFFSHDHCSYTSVRAEEDSVLYFVERNQIPRKGTVEYCEFLDHAMPMVVNEIYLRQMLTINSISEKESAIKKLFEHERMASLGQLAAGLAHELNNAVSVILSKAQWVTRHLKEYISEKDSRGFYPYFLKTLNDGQTVSSVEVRGRKKKIQSLLQVRETVAKRLARMDLTDEEMQELDLFENEEAVRRLGYYWEAGLALHDLNVAASHTTHVVQSIKELGARNKSDLQRFYLNDSIKKALSLLSQVLKNIELEVSVDQTIALTGKEGDFIQIWVNLIKNAAESIHTAPKDDSRIEVSATTKEKYIELSISDNGPGIDEASKTKIFQPDYSTKVSGLSFGLGLGLSIVQKILDEYNGTISVECFQGWTQFIVRIPKS